jgi:ABC-type Zn uptake system ZnuABC Zn-binding protein ZnuA
MKRIYLYILILLIPFANHAQTPKVLATTTMIADMAQNIVGDKLNVESLLPLGGDPHIYEPTPTDVKRVTEAELILVNGLTLEGWMKELIDNSGTKAKVITVTEGVNALTSAEHQGSSDPHAWMTASNGLIYVQNILKAVTMLTPTHADYFVKKAAIYSDELKTLDAYMYQKMAEIPEKRRILITSHDAFHYYGLRYGLRLESVLGTSTDADVQTSDIIRLINVIKKSGVTAIFVESTINPKLLKQIAKDNNVVIGGSLFADSMGDSASGADSYLNMLKHNTDVIANALSLSKNAIESQQMAQNIRSHDESGTEGGLSLSLMLLCFWGFVAFCGAFIYVVAKREQRAVYNS